MRIRVMSSILGAGALIVFSSIAIAGDGVTAETLESLLQRDDPVIVELGAAEGTDTRQFLKQFKNARVYSFEPDPRSIKLFKQNIQDSRCTLVEKAVSDKDGKMMFHLSSGWPKTNNPLGQEWRLSSSIKESQSHSKDYPWLKFDEDIEVESVRLDTWIKDNNISLIDFIWCDIQGAEREMIHGATETLKITRYLFTEYGEVSVYAGALSRKETIQLMSEHGFDLIEKHSSSTRRGNLLFKNKNSL